MEPVRFHLFTKESITKIEQLIAEKKEAKELAKKKEAEEGPAPQDDKSEEDKPKPNPALEAGKPLPKLMDDFPPELFGKPIEEIDEFYGPRNTFVVVGRDKAIFRFSAHTAFFLLSPFNPVRRTAILILTHPLFSLFVMVVILVNCGFMASNAEVPNSEEIFTFIYTLEGLTKMLARGFILADFTYLRDAWNWLDFVVVALAYITMAIPLGNLAALRTFRVLRALKTVAVVPGLKTIIGALMEAVRRLRDVIILTVFVLSIFALIGLQIYQGTLKQKCVLRADPEWAKNATQAELLAYRANESNWFLLGTVPKLCGTSQDAGKCPAGYECYIVGPNPDYGYTNFDNFGWAMLCAFRLMTQDAWENLYQQIIRANGPYHMLFFVLIIFLGSFYLVNLILAIVAMSYDDCQKQAQEEREAEEAQAQEMEARLRALEEAAERGSPAAESMASAAHEHTGAEARSIASHYSLNSRASKILQSLPESPVSSRLSSRASQFSWKRDTPGPGGQSEWRPTILPYLENLALPYADDSTATTPLYTPPIVDLFSHVQTAPSYTSIQRRRYNSTNSFGVTAQSNSALRPLSFIARNSARLLQVPGFRFSDKKKEPTHFQWSCNHTVPLIPDRISRDLSRSESFYGAQRNNHFSRNSFVSHRLSASNALHMHETNALKDPHSSHASGKKSRRGSSQMVEEPKTVKDIIKAKCWLLLYGWECCPCWHRFAHVIELFITDAFVDMFITICIVVNTVFMAMDHANMTEQMTKTLLYGNYVFTTIFATEAALKILALGLFKYLKDKWNCFDIVIVVLSLVELGLANVKGLSILRSFRLLRVFKLAKSWPTLNLLIGIIGRTMGALGNLCFVLLIVIFIFAVMGMQLFGENYTVEKFGETPRWNFQDFLHSFMIVFRVLCGEWIQSMWDCIHCSGFHCVPFFLLTMIIGNLVVLNLFLALLLSSFGAESLSNSPAEESEPNKLQEAADRINRFIIYVKSHLSYCFKVRLRRRLKLGSYGEGRAYGSDGGGGGGGGVMQVQLADGKCERAMRRMRDVATSPDLPDRYRQENDSNEDEGCQYTPGSVRLIRVTQSYSSSTCSLYSSKTITKGEAEEEEADGSITTIANATYVDNDDDDDDDDDDNDTRCYVNDSDSDSTELTPMEPKVNEVNVVFVRYPDDCFPRCCAQFGIWKTLDDTIMGRVFFKWRMLNLMVVEHKYFETFIIIMILISSLALAIEDVYLPERFILKMALKYMDKVFTVIFVCEMIIKMSAYGFKKYFTDAWCWLDFIIVAISLVSLAAEVLELGNIGPFRALRTLRALRPLRAVSRWEGMRVVVNALVQAIPAIFNVLLVCLVFWLIFSIMAVNLFGGRFASCVDSEGTTVNATLVPNKDSCDNQSAEFNYTWENPKVNFDNVLIAYLALFQVATFKGWTLIMDDAVDSKEVNMQPEREIRVMMYLYFVFFIVFGSFFTLNLFIGVIIENFNMQKKKAGGSLEMFMSEDQKKYYNAMKKLGSKEPQKPIPKPKLKFQQFFFAVISNQTFDIFIMIIIMLNMSTMAMEHYDQTTEFEEALGIVNRIFIIIFTAECLMKLISLRWYYFKQAWNVFDFVVVVISILGLFMSNLIEDYFVSPTLLRVVRVFRIGRILRLVKSAKGIRTLLFSLAVSMPALFNIGLLLFLVMFIFSIFGMSFFMHVKHTNGIDDLFNFETFFRSMISLFQISTSAGWDGTLAGLMNDQPPDCNNTATEDKPNGDCGSTGMAILFLVTYLIMSFLVVINMYIAVILENFSQATEDVQQGLTQDDFDMYYEVWERYDEAASQYIPLEKLSEFVDKLEEPLRIPAPNLYKLVSMKLPICEGDRVHCVDILDALTKNFLGTQDDEAGDLADIQKGPERKDYHPISTTLQRQRQIFCAMIIQKAWRRHAAASAAARTSSTGQENGPRRPPIPRVLSEYDNVDLNGDDMELYRLEEDHNDLTDLFQAK